MTVRDLFGTDYIKRQSNVRIMHDTEKDSYKIIGA